MTATSPVVAVVLMAFAAVGQGDVVNDEPLAERVAARMQATLDQVVSLGIAGASAAIVLPDGTEVVLAAGWASTDDKVALKPADRMLSGSTGKTFVTAVAHSLFLEGRLDFDRPVASFFADDDPAPAWLDRLPNARRVTTRQLLRHTAGMPRYVFAPAFMPKLTAEIDRVWKPEELLEHVFDTEPIFAPGEGFAYADTHYIVVGLVIERITGTPFYELAQSRFVGPLGLAGSVPSNARRIPWLVQGHVVMGRPMGIAERTLDEGQTTYNMQFEWCGGGWANTPRDLAVWARALYGGTALDGPYLEMMLESVEAPSLGANMRYGLGVMLRETPIGVLRGHDGFMPGYLTSMGYYPDADLAAAIQLNEDDPAALGKPLADILTEIAADAFEELRAR